MSFRTAYNDLKNRNRNSQNRGLIRDKTPEQEKKMMDEYYIRMRKWTPSNGRK